MVGGYTDPFYISRSVSFQPLSWMMVPWASIASITGVPSSAPRFQAVALGSQGWVAACRKERLGFCGMRLVGFRSRACVRCR